MIGYYDLEQRDTKSMQTAKGKRSDDRSKKKTKTNKKPGKQWARYPSITSFTYDVATWPIHEENTPRNAEEV